MRRHHYSAVVWLLMLLISTSAAYASVPHVMVPCDKMGTLVDANALAGMDMSHGGHHAGAAMIAGQHSAPALPDCCLHHNECPMSSCLFAVLPVAGPLLPGPGPVSQKIDFERPAVPVFHSSSLYRPPISA